MPALEAFQWCYRADFQNRFEKVSEARRRVSCERLTRLFVALMLCEDLLIPVNLLLLPRTTGAEDTAICLIWLSGKSELRLIAE